LGENESRIFLLGGLDRFLVICPTSGFVALACLPPSKSDVPLHILVHQERHLASSGSYSGLKPEALTTGLHNSGVRFLNMRELLADVPVGRTPSGVSRFLNSSVRTLRTTAR